MMRGALATAWLSLLVVGSGLGLLAVGSGLSLLAVGSGLSLLAAGSGLSRLAVGSGLGLRSSLHEQQWASSQNAPVYSLSVLSELYAMYNTH